jgi:hypothetical protein
MRRTIVQPPISRALRALQLGRTLLNRVLTWLHHELPLAYRLAAPQRWGQDNRFCVLVCSLRAVVRP